MALIKVGSIGDFSVVALESAKKELPTAEKVNTFSGLSQVTKKVPPNSFDFVVSANRRGLALQSLQLEKKFQRFIPRLFHRTSEIYFLSWAWDMTGLFYYPGQNTSPSDCLIPLKGGQLREFIAAGALLFPARFITAGLALRMHIWELRQGVRKFGKVMAEVASAIQGSDLNTMLIGLGGGAAVATAGASGAIAIIEPVALDLAKRIGDILAGSGDRAVDYFEGYFPASDPWSTGLESHRGHGSTIVLNRLTNPVVS